MGTTLPDTQRWGNFREWTKNQHPVLSMFMAHELHPFSRSERFSVMVCYLCWAFFITAVFEQVLQTVILLCMACYLAWKTGVYRYARYRDVQAPL